MKLRFYKILVVSFCLFSKQKLFSQVHFEGNKIITPYLGFPNFGFLTIPNSELNGANSNYKSIGPLGIRAEYMVASNIGLGFDFIYNSYKLDYTRELTAYYGNLDAWITKKTSVHKEMKRFRLQFRFNYHYETSNPNLDWYAGFGIGSNSRIYKNFENGIEIPQNSINESDTTLSTTSTKTVPISARICGGLNYYFTSKFAFGIEIGLGGPLISTSISYKLF